MIGDEDTISRVGTPAVANTESESATMASKENGSAEDTKEEGAEPSAPATPVTLPVEVRQKLRKLEKLEPKYSGITYVQGIAWPC